MTVFATLKILSRGIKFELNQSLAWCPPKFVLISEPKTRIWWRFSLDRQED